MANGVMEKFWWKTRFVPAPEEPTTANPWEEVLAVDPRHAALAYADDIDQRLTWGATKRIEVLLADGTIVAYDVRTVRRYEATEVKRETPCPSK